MVDVTTTYN